MYVSGFPSTAILLHGSYHKFLDMLEMLDTLQRKTIAIVKGPKGYYWSNISRRIWRTKKQDLRNIKYTSLWYCITSFETNYKFIGVRTNLWRKWISMDHHSGNRRCSSMKSALGSRSYKEYESHNKSTDHKI